MKKSKSYYNKLDKRSKEYKDWKKMQDILEDEVMEIEDARVESIVLTSTPDKGLERFKSEGLGDTVEKILKKTGVKKMVDLFMDGKDCGCEKRKNFLNEHFRYKAECLVKSESDYLIEYNKRHDPKRFEDTDIKRIIDIHARVFGKRPQVCRNCNGSIHVMNKAIDNLNIVLKTYENEI